MNNGRRQQLINLFNNLLRAEFVASQPELVDLVTKLNCLPISELITTKPFSQFGLTEQEAVQIITGSSRLKNQFFTYPANYVRLPFQINLSNIHLTLQQRGDLESIKEFVYSVTGNSLASINYSDHFKLVVKFNRPEEAISFWRALPYIRYKGQTLMASAEYIYPKDRHFGGRNYKKDNKINQHYSTPSSPPRPEPKKIQIEKPNHLSKKDFVMNRNIEKTNITIPLKPIEILTA